MTADKNTAAYDVLVVGCGLMGSALARALAHSGLRVAAWNRTFERAEALAGAGIHPVRDISVAIQDSATVLACTANYDNLYAAFGFVDAWHGTLVVNLTTGTPDESVAFAIWADERGAEVLDGSIFNYPRQVGSPEAHFVYSGAESAWRRGEPVLARLGPSRFVPGSHGLNSELLQGLTAYLVPAVSCFVEAATYLQRRGMPKDVLLGTADYLTESLKATIREAIDSIETGDLASDQASLQTFAESVESALVAFAAEGLNARILRATLDSLDAARAEGLGEQSIYAQTHVM